MFLGKPLRSNAARLTVRVNAEGNHLIGEILKYHKEDLAATWAVLEWLWSK